MGKYSIQEISTKEGYLIDNTIYNANLEYKDSKTPEVEFKLQNVVNGEPHGKIKIYKIDEKGNVIGGATFKITAGEDIKNRAGTEVYYTKGQTVAIITSANETGIATKDNLPLGKYLVQEQSSANGYLLNDTIFTANLEYKNEETAEVEFKIQGFVNNEPRGSISIYKVNENKNPIGGAIFQVTAGENIYNKSGKNLIYRKGEVVDNITSDEYTGIASIDGLYMGKYNVKEIKAPEGYLLSDKIYTAILEYKDNKTPHVEFKIEDFVNDEPRGSITIVKKDSKKGATAQGNATLKDAVYEVYAKEDIQNVAKTIKYYSAGDLVATRTTNERGETEKVTNLPLGKYVVKEKIASKGYLLDKKEYEVNLKYKNQKVDLISEIVTSNEDVKSMKVHIFKSGINIQSGLVPGLEGAEFTIKLYSDVQKALDAGYTYEEIWSGIDEKGNTVKVDSNRVAKAQVIAPTYETIITDEDGNAYTEEDLPYGKYMVKETFTPQDYESAEDFTFSITQDSSEVKEVAQKVKHLVVNNEQLEAYIKLIKKDLKTGKIVTLNSATFEIKATEDIYDRATEKIIWKKGEKISQKIGSKTYTSFTTNSDNIIVAEDSYLSNFDELGSVVTPLTLPVGKYEITEISTPDGFLQLEKTVKFEIKGIKDYDKDKDEDFILEVVVKNEKPTGTLIVDKTIAVREDVDTSLVDISDLSGIKFKLSAKENIIDMSDGSIIYSKGQEVKVFNVDKNGDYTLEELPMGVYELQEIETLDGLVLNDTKYEVKFEQKDLVTKVYEEEKEIVNDTTIFEFSKTDITGDEELVGATLTIIDKDNNIIDTWVSKESTHKIEGLKVGETYILREEIAPDGYVKATDIEFKVESTTEIQKVTMIDKIVEMSKVDIAEDEIEGAELKVTDLDGNIIDSWTSSKELHKIKGLEEEKTYILIEDYAPDGYVISNQVKFTVTMDKETQKVEMVDKIVEVLKIDVDGNTIEGVTLTIISNRTKNIVDKWVTEKEPHKVCGLIEGETYILHEEVVIDGYVKATDIEFTVTTEKETQTITMIDKVVEITKTDLVTGEELEGAELQVVDEDGNIIDEWVSTKEPHKVKGLEENKKYKLIEKTAPYGYELTETIEFIVTEEKETQKIEMKDMPILKDIRVIKVDSETNEIIKDKFVFGLYEDAECTKMISEIESNKEDGYVTFEDLRYGIYYLKEIKSPKGYILSEEIVKVEINDMGVWVNDNLIEENDEVYSFEFENEIIETPNTGDSRNTIGYVLAFIMSALGIAIISIVSYKKKQNNE